MNHCPKYYSNNFSNSDPKEQLSYRLGAVVGGNTQE